MATPLPPLPGVQRLSPRVIRILGDNPSKFTLQGTNTYLVGTGGNRLLIDTAQGFPAWRERLYETLDSEHATVSHALLTHWHHDHVSGVGDLLAICPNAKIHKHSPDEGLIAISDGQVFKVNGATLKALHCPGHTTDHMAFTLEEEGAMFTGDNVLGHGTAVFEDLATYLASLAKMREQGAANGRAYPGHGVELEDRNGKIEEYISHRKQREEEILQALAGGEKTPMEIVKVVYAKYPVALHEPARGGVMQILWKLQEEGEVEEGGEERWLAMKAAGKAAL